MHHNNNLKHAGVARSGLMISYKTADAFSAVYFLQSPSMATAAAAILVLLCLMLHSMATAMVARQINIGQTGRDINDITLMCTDINDEPITNAVFYRNGARILDDPCFSGNINVSSDGSAITITVPPPCEGYFMCREYNGMVVSLPTTMYGRWIESLHVI